MRDGWRELPLGDIAVAAPAGTFDPKAAAGVPYVGMEHLDPEERGISRWGQSDETASSKTPFGPNDVLYGKLRPYLKKVALADRSGVCSTEIIVLRPRDGRVAPDFLYYVCASRELLAYAINHSAGTRMPRISPSLLLKATVNLPPPEEQRRIADLLTAIDGARQAQSRRVVLAWDLLLRMTDLAMATPEWPVRRLDEVADIGAGITKGGKRSSGATRRIPYLRVANVQHGRLDLGEVSEIDATDAEIEKHAVEAADVLLLEGGNKEDVGRGWIWSGEIDECLHQNHLHRARAKRHVVEPRFLAYAICSKAARAYCLINAKQTSNLATINRTQISGLPVPIPDLDKQRRVAALLDSLRSEYEQAANARDRLSSLRPALLGVLLSGAHKIPDGYDRVLSEDGRLPNLALAAA